MFVHSAVSGNPLIKPRGNYCLKLPGAFWASRDMQGHVPPLSQPSGIECTLQIVHVFRCVCHHIHTDACVLLPPLMIGFQEHRGLIGLLLTTSLCGCLTCRRIRAHRHTQISTRGLKVMGSTPGLGCISLSTWWWCRMEV